MIKLEDLKKLNREAAKAVVSLSQSARDVIREQKITFLEIEKVIARTDICHKCPFYNDGSCNLCGCQVSVKARIDEFRCPLGKWNPTRVPYSWVFDETEIERVPRPFYRTEKIIYSYFRNDEGIWRYETNLETNETALIKV